MPSQSAFVVFKPGYTFANRSRSISTRFSFLRNPISSSVHLNSRESHSMQEPWRLPDFTDI